MKNNIYNEKNNLRTKYKEKRRNIIDKKEKSKVICKKIINSLCYKNANVIAIYRSLPDEVDTTDLILNSLKNNKRVLLPRVINSEIKFFEIKDLNYKCEKSKFNILEPVEDYNNYVEKNEIDLIIVPGLCFDKNGNRLGFGKGFYDRFLADISTNIIGICFKEQIIKKVPITNDDIKVNYVITD